MDKEIIYKIVEMIDQGKSCKHEFSIERQVETQTRPHRVCSKCGTEILTEPGYMIYPEAK